MEALTAPINGSWRYYQFGFVGVTSRSFAKAVILVALAYAFVSGGITCAAEAAPLAGTGGLAQVTATIQDTHASEGRNQTYLALRETQAATFRTKSEGFRLAERSPQRRNLLQINNAGPSGQCSVLYTSTGQLAQYATTSTCKSAPNGASQPYTACCSPSCTTSYSDPTCFCVGYMDSYLSCSTGTTYPDNPRTRPGCCSQPAGGFNGASMEYRPVVALNGKANSRHCKDNLVGYHYAGCCSADCATDSNRCFCVGYGNSLFDSSYDCSVTTLPVAGCCSTRTGDYSATAPMAAKAPVGQTSTAGSEPPASLIAPVRQSPYLVSSSADIIGYEFRAQTDAPYHDIKVYRSSPQCYGYGVLVSSAYECSNECSATNGPPMCVGFVHDPPTSTSTTGCCFLKSAIQVATGVSLASNLYTREPDLAGYFLLNYTDSIVNDISSTSTSNSCPIGPNGAAAASFGLVTPNAASCAALCNAYQGCIGFKYYARKEPAPVPTFQCCYLKYGTKQDLQTKYYGSGSAADVYLRTAISPPPPIQGNTPSSGSPTNPTTATSSSNPPSLPSPLPPPSGKTFTPKPASMTNAVCFGTAGLVVIAVIMN